MRRTYLAIGTLVAGALAAALLVRDPAAVQAPSESTPGSSPASELSGSGRPPSADRAAGTRALTGTVRRAGVPATAVVTAWRLDASAPGATAQAEAEALVRNPARDPDVSDRTDPAGRFTLTGTPARCWLVAASSDGRDAWRVATPDDVDIDLADGPHSLVVRAVHHDGRPFEGRLRLSEGDKWGRSPDEGPRFPVALDADGVATFRGLSPYLVSLVALAPPAFESMPMTILLPHDGEVRFVVDGPRRTVRGRVLDVDGNGVSGADVAVEPSAPGAGAFVAKTTADAAGWFTVESVEGALRVRATAPGFVPGSSEAATGTQSVEVRLRRAGRVHGVAREAATGRPVSGVRVALSRQLPDYSPYERSFREARTDVAGRFAFDDVEAGDVAIVAFGAGWMSLGLRDTRPDGFNPFVRQVHAGEDIDVALALEPAARLEGRVTAADGTPIARVGVRPEEACRYQGPSASLDAFGEPALLHVPRADEVETDVEGKFTVDTLLPRLRQQIYIFPPNATWQSHEVFPAEGETVRLDVVVSARPPESPRVIDIRVVAADDGSPIGGATIDGTDSEGRRRQLATSAPDGRARVTSVAGSISVQADGFYGDEDRADGAGLVVTLQRVPVVEGRVVWPDASAAAGADVIYAYSKGPERTTTDAEGRFRGRSLFAKSFHVEARARRGDRWFRSEADAKAGATDLVLRLAPDPSRGTLRRVRIVGPDGADAVSGDIRLEVQREELSLDHGLVEVWAPAGSAPFLIVSSVVTLTGGTPGPARVSVPESTETLLVRLPPGKSLRGRVVRPSGDGIEGVSVEARTLRPGEEEPSFDGWPAVTRTRSDGSFVLEGLGDVDYSVHFSVPEVFVAPDDVRTHADGDPVGVRLVEEVRPWVEVVDGGGHPVAGAEVLAIVIDPDRSWDESHRATARTDARGRARLERLPPKGALTLRVEPPRSRDDVVPFRAERWRPADTRVVLENALVITGRLRDREGKPLIAEIELKDTVRDRTLHARSEADGRFRLTGMPAGSTTLTVRLGRWPWARDVSLPVFAPSDNPDLVVDEGDTIELSLEPDPGSGVRWQVAPGDAPADEYSNHVFGAHDRFVIHGVEAGDTYSIYVEANGKVATATGVRPSRIPVRLSLVPGRSVSGHVREGPKAATRCTVVVEGPGFRLEGWTDDEGAFAIKGVPPGSWTVHATEKRGDVERVAAARVEAGATDVELTLAPR